MTTTPNNAAENRLCPPPTGRECAACGIACLIALSELLRDMRLTAMLNRDTRQPAYGRRARENDPIQ